MIKISSPAFKNGDSIPKKYTCDGENISPPLTFENIPAGTQSLVLTIEDPNTQNNIPWVHWLVFNIPPTTTEFKEGKIGEGATEGLCNGNTFGYEGPCPSVSKHHYIFKVYALDIILPLSPESNIIPVKQMMKEHIIEEGQMIGFYQKNKIAQKQF